MGLWAIWMSVGQIVAFNLTPALRGVMSWNNIWRIYACWTLILILIMAVAIKKPEGLEAAQEAASTGEKVSAGILFANKGYMMGLVSFFMFNWLLLTHLTFLPGFMGATGIITGAAAGFAGSFTMICALLGSPILGRISDSIGRKTIYITALLAAGLGLLLPFTGSAVMIYIGCAIMGFLGLAAPGMILGAIPELVGNPKAEGLAMGILFTFVNLGQFLATAVFPDLLGAMGGNYITTAIILEVLALIGIITAAMVKFKK
jgi:MFS family permease